MRRFLEAIVLASVLWAGGCKSDEVQKPEIPPVQDEPEQAVEDVHPLMQMRQAFGLPFPPDVQYVRKGPNYVEVGTSLTVNEVEKFFKGRLVDYEFFRIDKTRVNIVGLHSTQPKIWVIYRAPNIPIAVRYVDQIGAQAREERRKQPAVEPVAGEEVKTRTADGRLLAPGARYGQPYSPKPGDPLYQEGYRANFGKPYGSWVLN